MAKTEGLRDSFGELRDTQRRGSELARLVSAPAAHPGQIGIALEGTKRLKTSKLKGTERFDLLAKVRREYYFWRQGAHGRGSGGGGIE